MTRKEQIDLLMKARNILHKNENGEKLTGVEIMLAHDYVDMVIDDMVNQEFALKMMQEDFKQSKEAEEWLSHQLDMADDYASKEL